uniref:Selectin P ligand n=1 Tax=Paramormyrops kingsleyae TaxID=1676925 RepID=A0A3B3TC62_9TELE|nr:P-selectin glycoprotein ligand 1 [Paramormyrops kingsleyae]
MAPWAFSLMLWAAVMFPQALLQEANGTLSPDMQAPTTLSGMQEASSIGALAVGGSTMAPILHETEAASILPLIGGTQEPIKIEVTDQGGTTSQPANDFQSATNHQLLLALTSKAALASSSSVNNTSTHAPSNITYSHSTPTLSTHSMSNSTSGLPGSTPTLLNLIHSISSSIAASPHSTPPLSDTTHSASQSSTGLSASTSVTSNSTAASLHKRKGSSDSTQASVISTSKPTDSTNSSMGAVVPKKPLTTASATTRSSTIHHEGNNASGGSNCLSRKDGLVSQCLIAIASLAAVATFFMVCTIFLCTKLSAQKHRYRMSMNQGTEMMCISSLLPDGDVAHAKLRYPKSNGALIPSVDESEGDDLTLHSFLPENERTA